MSAYAVRDPASSWLTVDRQRQPLFDLAMPRAWEVVVLLGLTVGAWSRSLRADDRPPTGTVITMLRGGCEKRCPVYRVVVFGDGTVLVQGEHYLRKPVLAKSEIPVAEVTKLVDRFKAIDYFNLTDDFGFNGRKCTSTATSDAPNVTTSIVAGGRGRSITHHLGCLGTVADQLSELERAIDETAHTRRWLGTAVPQARN
jgi:hypothetical protein